MSMLALVQMTGSVRRVRVLISMIRARSSARALVARQPDRNVGDHVV